MTDFPPPPPPDTGMSTTKKALIAGGLVLGGLVVGGALAGGDDTDEAATTTTTTTTQPAEPNDPETMSDAEMLEEVVWPEFEAEVCAAVQDARTSGFSDSEIRQVAVSSFLDSHYDQEIADQFWDLIQEEC